MATHSDNITRSPNYQYCLWPALTGLFLYLFSVYIYGLGITDDSVNYLSAAISFPHGLQKVDGSAFVEWPPLYPVIISLYKIAGIDILTFVILLQGFSVLITIWSISSVLNEETSSFPVLLTGMTLTVFSVPLLLIHVFVWSEGIFTMFILLAYLKLRIYIKSESKTAFLLLVLWSVLLSFQRKSGIIVDVIFATLLFSFLKRKTWPKRLQYSCLYLFSSVIPFIIYLITRQKRSGTFFTSFEFDIFQLVNNLSQTLDIITSWLLPNELELRVRVAICFLITFSGLWLYVKSRKFTIPPTDFHKASSFVILLLYILSIIFIFLFLRLGEPFDDRIFAPVYPFFIFLIITTIDSIYFNILLLPVQRIGYLRKIFLAVIFIWCFYPISRTLYTAYNWRFNGVGGYSSRIMQENRLCQWLSKSVHKHHIVTEDIFPVFFYTNIVSGHNKEIYDRENILKNKPYFYVCFQKCHSREGKRVLGNGRENSVYFIPEKK